MKLKIERLRTSAIKAKVSDKCFNIELLISALSGLRGGISTNKGVSLPGVVFPLALKLFVDSCPSIGHLAGFLSADIFPLEFPYEND